MKTALYGVAVALLLASCQPAEQRTSAEVFAIAVSGTEDEVTALVSELKNFNGTQDVELTSGARPTSISNASLLHVVAARGMDSATKTLLANGAPVDALSGKGGTPLHLASYVGASETIRVLVQAGADVGARDSRGTTPLGYAAASGDVDSVSVLLAAGSDPNAADSTGTTPLVAVLWSDIKPQDAAKLIKGDSDSWRTLSHQFSGDVTTCLKLLLESGADPLQGTLPVVALSVAFGDTNAAGLLLKRTDNLNMRLVFGGTLLHIAAGKDDLPMIRLLVGLGASKESRDTDGKLPHEYATKADVKAALR